MITNFKNLELTLNKSTFQSIQFQIFIQLNLNKNHKRILNLEAEL